MSEEPEGEEVEDVEIDPITALPDPNESNAAILGIRGQQAVGVPNIITQTGRNEAGSVEMLYDPVAQQIQPDELITDTDKFISEAQRNLVSTPQGITNVADITVEAQDAAQIENVERTFSNVPTITAATGTITENDVIDPNQIVDERTKQQMLERGSLAEAKTQTLANEASVQFQIEQLLTGIETGDIPPWASPVIRKTNEIMNSRGLGASSMAAAATAQALIESTIPIAAQDAQAHANLQIRNLTNQQQTALANAATIAAMDRQNLDNRMKAAQQNAQSFLNMNLKNTTNEQQVAVLDYQSKVQSLFTDAAAENASKQFNATSQNQVNQFYDQLGATVEQANAARDVAIQKFNSEEITAVDEFNVNLENSRDQFNISMRNQIDQSNAQWRRSINTANTANENRANQINAGILLGLTTQAQNQLWQKYRDEAHQLFTTLQNETHRNHQIVIEAMRNQFNVDTFNRSVEFKKQVAAGAASQSILRDAIDIGAQVLGAEVVSKDGKKTSLGGSIVSSILGFALGDEDSGSGSGSGSGSTLGGGLVVTGTNPKNPTNDPFFNLIL